MGEVGGADDEVTTYRYTSRGLIDRLTDPLGRITDFDYDSLGRLQKITYAKGTSDEAFVQYEYDAAGNKAATVDENGNRTEYRYNLENNRLEQVIEADPDGDGLLQSPTTTYTYDARGNVKTSRDARANVTRYEYDVLDRPEKMTEPDPDGNGALKAPVTSYHYDPVGNLTEMIDPLGRKSRYRYDVRNYRIETINPDQTKTKTQYNAEGDVIYTIDEAGHRTNFFYDSRGRLERQVDVLGGKTLYEYDVANQLISVTDANQHQTQYRALVNDEMNQAGIGTS